MLNVFARLSNRLLVMALVAVAFSAGCRLKIITPTGLNKKILLSSDRAALTATLSLKDLTSTKLRVDSAARIVAIENLESGRLFSVMFEENGSPAAGLVCAGLPTYALVNEGVLHLALPSGGGATLANYTCATDLGSLTVSLSTLPSALESINSNLALAAGNGTTVQKLSVSGDGRWTVFALAGETLFSQIYAYDRTTGIRYLVSSPDGITLGSNHSANPLISRDGSRILFSSQADNLVAGISRTEIYTKLTSQLSLPPTVVSTVDGTLGGIANHSVGASPSTYNFAMTPDGRYVAFISNSTNLVSGATGLNQIYKKDLQAMGAAPLLISSGDGTGSTIGNAASTAPAISDDGKYVVFITRSSNWYAGTNTYVQIYVKDSQAMASLPRHVSNIDGSVSTQANSSTNLAQITPDGNYIVFGTYATNLISGMNGAGQVVMKDRRDLTLAPTLVSSVDGSIATQGVSTGYTSVGGVSADSKYALLASSSSNLWGSTGSSLTHLVRKNLQTLSEVPLLVDARDGSLSTLANAGATAGGLANNGQLAAFASAASNLGVISNGGKILQKNLGTPTVVPVSIPTVDLRFKLPTPRVSANTFGYGAPLYVSSNGEYATFKSADSQFFPSTFAPGASGEIIVRRNLKNLAAPIVRGLVAPNGDAPNGYLYELTVSKDGRHVIYETSATNIIPGLSGTSYNLIHQDLDNLAAGYQLVSTADGTVATQENHGLGRTSWPKISGNGRYVTLETKSTYMNPNGNWEVFVKDLQNLSSPPISVSSTDGTTAGLGNSTSDGASISDDGRYVAFYSYATNLVAGLTGVQILVKDLQNLTGPFLLASSLNGTVATQASSGDGYMPTLSGNGRYVAFQSASANLIAPTAANGKAQIYVKDLQNMTTPPILASTLDGTGANQGNGDSVTPVLSDDGRYVVFCSLSTNFVTGVTGSPGHLYRKDLQNLAVPPVLVTSNNGLPSGVMGGTFSCSGGNIAAFQVSGPQAWVGFYSYAAGAVRGLDGLGLYLWRP